VLNSWFFQVLVEAPGEQVRGGGQQALHRRQEEDQGAEGPRRQSRSKSLRGPRNEDQYLIFVSFIVKN
jgi:hypothetical protein